MTTTDLRLAARYRRLLDDLEGLFDLRLPQRQYDRGVALIAETVMDVEQIKEEPVRRAVAAAEDTGNVDGYR